MFFYFHEDANKKQKEQQVRKLEIVGAKFNVDDKAYVLRHNGTRVILESVKIKNVSVNVTREDATMGGELSYSISYNVGHGHKLGKLEEHELFRDREEALKSIQ